MRFGRSLNLLVSFFAYQSPRSVLSLTCQRMSGSQSQAQLLRLQKNADVADQLIADIQSKMAELTKANVSIADYIEETPELKKLREENVRLLAEVEKAKDALILQEIRYGLNPVIGNPRAVGVAKSVSSSSTVESRTEKVSNKAKPKPEQPAQKNDKSAPPNANKKAGEAKAKPEKTVTPAPTPAATSDAAAPAGEADVGKLDFRIGLIEECSRHPDADALYVEKINLGEGKPRTIISGLVKHVPIEEMQNRMVVVLCNLKPAKMRGILSEGMVMCASTPEKVEILIPPKGVQPGDLVEIEEHQRCPEPVLNPKKKIFETCAPHLKTNANKEATFQGKLWKVKDFGPVVAASLANVPIK